ncbi:SDR family NAD(P)-dependent oxidoreductase [Mesorhizobium sp. 10J20-29]
MAAFKEEGVDMLSGKVALVTGTSAPNGIGRAIALKLARNGAHVVVTDIDGTIPVEGGTRATSELLEELVSEIGTLGAQAIAVKLDVTRQADIETAVTQTIKAFGRLDILVNNAGSLVGADNFLATTPEQWETSFRVNVLGPMMMAQAVIPQMKRNGGGRIVNIGSTGSLGAEPGFGAYTAMKHALVGLSKTIAAEFGSAGILCNTVCPGFIATDMHQSANERLAAESGLALDDMKARRYANVALREAGLPSDVADAVAYLAGPEARYVTGINLPVAGGVPIGI